MQCITFGFWLYTMLDDYPQFFSKYIYESAVRKQNERIGLSGFHILIAKENLKMSPIFVTGYYMIDILNLYLNIFASTYGYGTANR